MKQLKKTLLTLVALLAVTTQAWAQTETLLTTITATAKEQASYSTANMATVSFSYTGEGYSVYNDNWGWWGYGWIATVTAAEGYTITKCIFYDNDGASATDSTDPFIVESEEENKKPKVNGATFGAFTSAGIKSIEVYGIAPSASSASSGPEVAWDKAKNSGSFTMLGGNVTLEPEYYPQATVAEGAVTAAEADARATTDDPLVKVDATKLTGAKKLMYFVSNSGTTAPAYDAEGWTDQLPTAEGFTQQGIVYVWYYPVGTDEGQDDATATYNDGDIKSLTVTIAPEPTYAVTFADGVNPEPPAEPEWTASPAANVTKGTPVTVTYTGSKKVIGVKAEKKAATPSLSLTNPTVGQVIGSDGKNYAYASLPTGVTAVAKICYVSGNNGLALALTDEGTMNWSTAIETCAAHTPAFTGGTWKLATQDEWNSMISAAGSDTALRDGFSSVGGTNMQSNAYWSSTGSGSYFAWYYFFNYSYWNDDDKDRSVCVRAVLEF